MKTRITILAENDEPMSALGDNPEELAKEAWEAILHWLMRDNGRDKAIVEKVEVFE
jgi:hypothetical protein